ncbi:f-box domain-containing protein [Gigaspora margarita]|uniref:F-box domain-containing protein n=1 Tax=Gigaspora margarita TaxID=4874 RepID=A0A8H4ERR8_GIGMA|nr:f-box domain-containing protein [Gigaspora margarita]
MSSKMFMPELMEIVFNNLNNEIYSLYSCALVSRHWCKMSIPFLWQNPFSFCQNPLFISQYFSYLDENEKSVLKECGINVKFPKTLFNYAKFLKVLDLTSLKTKVREWIVSQLTDSKPQKSSIYLIINLLFKLFVESGATLHKLDLDLYFYQEIIHPEIFYTLGRNEQFFSRLQDLSLDGISEFNIESVTVLLGILEKNTTSINVLKLELYSDYIPRIFHALERIIKAQEQLRQFSLIGKEEYLKEFHGIISSLESQNESLHEVTIGRCTCNTEFKVLMNCKNLGILRINDCGNLNILEASLNTLEITCYPLYASSIVPILKKSGMLLQRLSIVLAGEHTQEKPVLLETLKSFCPNITYLNLPEVEFSTQFFGLISNLQKLQFLTLWDIYDVPGDEPEKLIMQFAELLPLTLQYLDLRNSCLSEYIDVLFNNCNAPLKYLLIDYLLTEKGAKALIEFCIRRKTLNYVCISIDLVDNLKKDIVKYVTLVPYNHIAVNC